MKKFFLLFVPVLYVLSVSAQTSPCTRDTSFHVVVLGSSTAAGAGATHPDSAWVNRYRAHLQSLNPAYQVTNRAVGGFTTYRLMPTGYLPPANRPAPDTTHNITYAIGLNPDAIIINLPSNDVSSGYTVAEQLENFDTLTARAAAANIPIWVTTTQPKNYGNNPIPIQKQQDVRDSLIAIYSPFVIDFWTGLADSTNQLSGTYDSGDGTHLNDDGHALVFGRAAATDIPGFLYTPPAFTDYVADELREIFNPLCGDPNAQLELVLYNRGLTDQGDVPFQVIAQNLSLSQQSSYFDTLVGGLNGCTEDTLPVFFSTQQAGDYRISVVLQSGADPNSSNDTVSWTTSVLGTPTLTLVPDTGCGTAALQLTAQAAPGDSIRWWDAATGGSQVGGGPLLTTPLLNSSTTYWAEALRGEFINRGEIFTTSSTNINWNGTMFDLVADTNLVLDSFAIRIFDTGAQTVVFHTRPGSHLGFETDAAAWTPRGTASVQVNDPDVPVVVSLGGGWTLNAGDTLGVYLSLQNSGARLRYQSLGQPAVRSTPELTMITGSGASFNFGGNFYPRDWNGTVFYHFGTKPDADCQSGRMPVEALISSVSVDLGADTILPLNAAILLDPGSGYASYNWSTGATTPTVQLDGSVLGQGIYTVTVTVTDSAGCIGTDEVIVVFAPLVGQAAPSAESLEVWPNPAPDGVRVAYPQGTEQLAIYDLEGRRLLVEAVSDGAPGTVELDVSPLAAGMYLLEARGGWGTLRKRLAVTGE